MQIQGACLWLPVALFGRGVMDCTMRYDTMSRGWSRKSGKGQVSPVLSQSGSRSKSKRDKKETCQNVSKVGCSTALGRDGSWVDHLASPPPMHLPVELAALATIFNRGRLFA